MIGQKLLLFFLTIVIVASSGCATTKKRTSYSGIEGEDVFDTPVGTELIVPAGSKILNPDGTVFKEFPVETKLKLKKPGVWFSDDAAEIIIKGQVN